MSGEQAELGDDFPGDAVPDAGPKRSDGYASRQQVIKDRTPNVPARHLTHHQPPSNIVDLEADPERGEFWCRNCGARVTRSGTGKDVEYGHERGCEHRVRRAHDA